ncbi:hypothetical protein KQI86_06870 [Clostridium sp. MSJ-11]|uniref:DUF4179 domain-containing protein n=1 Tax=Clostridium mobile TaxID=2841512 RepID=A0ABS6EG95_9CLOT|nr:DUF4179 domain-containing protein [Clostridium mobile]MBU5484048.1 hypothetical protein [Clostridium mobile]
MSNKIDDFKKIYEEIEIPNNLDEVVNKALENGGNKMNKEKSNRKWIKGAGVAAAVAVVFTISVNTMPVFANSLINIPGVGQLVKVLQFNDGKGTGGEITDGSDVNAIRIKANKDSESIIINFAQNGEGSNIAPSYEIDYKNNPYTMTFTISGARELNAEKYFDDLRESKYVSDVYKLMTLDDSMVRFTVVFNKPIKYEVKEYKEPAYLEVDLREDTPKEETMYSVRTASQPFGEGIGIVEEILFEEDGKRMLKDSKGTFCVELGLYNSKEEAEKKLQEVTAKYGSQLKFFIEERMGEDIPKSLN